MKKTIFLALMTVVALTTYAQTGMESLSLSQALDKALSNNPAVMAAQAEEDAAREERRAAAGLRLPQIGVTGAYVYMGDDIGVDLNGAKPFVGSALTDIGDLLTDAGLPIPEVLQNAEKLLNYDWDLTIQERDFGFVGGTVTMPVFTGGKINAANRAARLTEMTAAEKGTQTRGALVSEVVERYYGLVLAQDALKIRLQVYDAMQAHLSDAKALEAEGMIARADRLYVEVMAAEAERDLLAAGLELQTISAALGNTLNDAREFVPVSDVFVLNNIEPVSYFKQMAEDGNPQLRQVALTRDLAEQAVKLERSEYFPQVALMGGYNFYTYQMSKAIPNWVVGAGVKWNIFDGLSRERKISAAKHTVRQVEAVQVKAGNDIAVLIEQLYNEMQNYSDRLSSLDKSMEFAEEYLRAKNVGFREGASTASDLIDAELNLAKSRIERIQAAYLYDLMLARMLEAAGVSEMFEYYATGPSAMAVKYYE